MEAAIPSFQLQLIPAPAHDATALDEAIASFAEQPHGSLLIFPDAFPIAHRQLIISQASKNRLPVMYPFPSFVTEGDLMSYGVPIDRLIIRSVDYIDRILRGARPADLPVQQPNQFQFLVNAKTAKELGLTLPQTLLADEVIE
ncbi:ABC transporter substrate binding protein [Bradyrhizobium sp. CB1650]|uniref:ABC transporter substrate binding protein n=1 Tax=Bradyrhizobium sp. CB1650 TaxID=3039153 RepID=UPI0024352C41|nr:ABC transporter substrate binding protein [Bradyrhizobium sp. CB1650]WGD55256.1 ABC transporter substrate binding protein [Bradyrhizobium sp. CB1650]